MAIYTPDEQGNISALEETALDMSQAASQIAPGDLGAAFAKMFVSLILLIVLLGVSYWFLRKLIQNRLQKGYENAAIQILEKRMISPKTMLYLVEVNQKKILFAESHLEIKRLNSEEAPPPPIENSK